MSSHTKELVSFQKKNKKAQFYLRHKYSKEANLEQLFSESRSGTIASKNQKRITAGTHYQVKMADNKKALGTRPKGGQTAGAFAIVLTPHTHLRSEVHHAVKQIKAKAKSFTFPTSELDQGRDAARTGKQPDQLWAPIVWRPLPFYSSPPSLPQKHVYGMGHWKDSGKIHYHYSKRLVIAEMNWFKTMQ